jgi:hypothetical protein
MALQPKAGLGLLDSRILSNSVFGNYLLSQHPSISSLASKHLTSHHHPGYSLTLQTLRYYPDIPLQGLGKTTKNVGRDSRSSDRDLNPRPPELKECKPLDHDVRYILVYHLGVNNRPVGARSSEI